MLFTPVIQVMLAGLHVVHPLLQQFVGQGRRIVDKHIHHAFDVFERGFAIPLNRGQYAIVSNSECRESNLYDATFTGQNGRRVPVRV